MKTLIIAAMLISGTARGQTSDIWFNQKIDAATRDMGDADRQRITDLFSEQQKANQGALEHQRFMDMIMEPHPGEER